MSAMPGNILVAMILVDEPNGSCSCYFSFASFSYFMSFHAFVLLCVLRSSLPNTLRTKCLLSLGVGVFICFE